jgi:hypothetical protein
MRVRVALASRIAFATIVTSGAARGDEPAPVPPRRGPIELREEWLLSQTRLTLPAQSPDVLPRGATRLRLQLDWGNDFGWLQDEPGEQPEERDLLVDGEHRTLALEWRRGLGRGLEAGARVPLRWRGGGVLDGVIDAFHVVTRALGLPDNERGRFETDRFRAEARDRSGRTVVWTAEPGTGLGNLELDLRWAADVERRFALSGRVSLPTGTGPFRASGLEAGAQALARFPLRPSLDLFTGAGATVFSETRLAGFDYARVRGLGFVALEWRPARVLSLLVQVDGSSRLVTGLAAYPGMQSHLRIGAKLDLPARLGLEAGFTENLLHQQATTDFGVFLGLTCGY